MGSVWASPYKNTLASANLVFEVGAFRAVAATCQKFFASVPFRLKTRMIEPDMLRFASLWLATLVVAEELCEDSLQRGGGVAISRFRTRGDEAVGPNKHRALRREPISGSETIFGGVSP